MRDLVVRDQRHDVDRVQALHTLQSREARVGAQVIVGDRDDLGDELAVRETLPDALQQFVALNRGGARTAARRQERQADTQRHAQLGDLILRRREAAARIEEFDQARRVMGLARGPVRRAQQSTQRGASGQHERGNTCQHDAAAGAKDTGLHGDSLLDVNRIGSMRGALSSRVAQGTTRSTPVAVKAPRGITR